MPIPEFVAALRSHVGTDLLWMPGVSAVVVDDDGRLLLGQRADTGQWAVISGILEPGEDPAVGLVREVREETGLAPERFYNVSRVEAFYQHRKDEVALVPVFVAFVEAGAPVRTGPEHDGHEWLPPLEAGARFAWPRERRALEGAVQLLGSGDGGPVEDVLRIC